MKTYCCKVAGVTFEGRQTIIARIESGDDILLIPDPDNLYDSNAVKVVWREKCVGFIPRELNGEIAVKMNGCSTPGFVMRTTGGTEDFPTLGLEIEFRI